MYKDKHLFLEISDSACCCRAGNSNKNRQLFWWGRVGDWCSVVILQNEYCPLYVCCLYV